MIPRSQIPWLLSHPDDVLSTSASHYDTLEGDYAFTDKRILTDPYHEHVIHKYLPRRIAPMIPDLQAEVALDFDVAWGTDTDEWKEIKVGDSVLSMLSQAVNRMILGLPLCRNEDLLSTMRAFTMDIVMTGFLLRFVPRWLRFIAGPLATLPNKYHYWKTTKYTKPLIADRLKNLQKKEEDPSFEWKPPNDFVTWSILLAKAEKRSDELTVDMLSRRIMPIEFAAIHTSSITITNCLLDLVSSDPSKQYLEGILEQSNSILAQDNGQWTKAGLARFDTADSALRESMRVSNFMTQNLVRKVVAKEGISNPTEGWHAPYGMTLSVDMHDIQHDPEVYPDPETYDAFRFSRPEEESQSKILNGTANERTANGNTNPAPKALGLVQTSDSFLPFSHGRHACPGRFFIAMEVKMFLSYMLTNYDIERLPSRPKKKTFGGTLLPPSDATFKVRRKKGTVKA